MSGLVPFKQVVGTNANRAVLTGAGNTLVQSNAGTNGDILTIVAGVPTFQPNAGGTLAEGNVFIGNSSNVPTATIGTAQGQVLQAGPGPNFFTVFDLLEAQYVEFTANVANNITATDVQAAIVEVAGERPYVYSTASNPTVNNDAVDTAAIGHRFKRGDVWTNTATNAIYINADATTGAAVWQRSDVSAISEVFTYRGTLNAAVDPLPSTPATGDYYRITVAGDFGGTFVPGLNVNDAIVYNGTTWDRIDNTDPTVSGTDIIDVTGNGTTGYTISLGGWSTVSNDQILFRQDADNVAGVGPGTALQVLRRNAAGTAFEFATLTTSQSRTNILNYTGPTVSSGTTTLTAFFTNAPSANGVTVAFNGITLTPGTDFTFTGTDLTLDIDSILVPLETGDRIVAFYTYS